ncbi:ribonuclease Z [Robiginitalea marina]|uniref:Ribonuclease Z n=1 Tax=Robiginitalea marina TaxID=2954105 RepID=A0ABT1AW26_9FLAO|nr:ribonuclease Z [Robiginitalea marina]
MKLQIMGCHAATPRFMTHPTAQVLELGGHLVLIDCGEGTQMQLRRFKVRFSRIEHIFISHLHGDHFFGLPGLISTFRLLGRENPLHLYGPPGIKEAITLLLKLGDSWTNYPLHFHELTATEPEVIFEDARIRVRTLPLDHRVYTNGFHFELREGERSLRAEVARAHGIDRAHFQGIKQGADAPAADGTVIPNALLTDPPPPPKHYAFCSDTAYKPSLVPLIKGVDVLYHEATFLEAHAGLAAKTKHATAAQAAAIARDAGVGELLLGHYSTRYSNLEDFREEALAVFPRVSLAEDGKTFEW